MNPAHDDSASDRRLEEILHAYLQAVDAGRAPDRDALLRQHPDLASELAAFLASQDEVAQLAQGMADPAAHAPRVADAPTLAHGETSVPALGTQVRYFGDYELLEEIARGGMGIVYKARQVSLNRPVALKMILAGQLASPTDVQRFHAEAQIAANLQHPNIVAIYEVGQHEGQYYFSMALVEGQSLAELIRENTLTTERAARYVKTVAEAIQFAHEQGTLHRDLKPSNILIDTFDQPRVTDFGLARRTEVDARLTATGAVLGTPSYLPPEQASGERGSVGPASDVYSLGAMLYELVTGRPPFRAATPVDTILLVLSTPPVAPRLLNPRIDRNLETIILKCLAKEPGDRYASARDLADDLGAYLEGRPIKARRAGRLERGRRWLRKHRRTLSLTAATAAVTALLVTGGMLAWLRLPPFAQLEPMGRILLTTAGGPLTAEALDDDDKPMAPRFTVPTAEPQTVPTGCYSFRFTAPGRCSETYRTFVGAEFQAQGHVTLEERRLWDPISVGQGETADVVNFGGHADVVLAGPEGIRRIDGASGKLVWKQAFDVKDDAVVAQFNKSGPRGRPSLGGIRLAQSTVDLDGDGIPDLVFYNSPWIMAVSGKTGKLLWFYDARNSIGLNRNLSQQLFLGPPSLITGDDGPIIVATYLLFENGRVESLNAIWVEAIRASTGKLLWRSTLKQWRDAGPAFRFSMGPRGLEYLGQECAFAVHALRFGQQHVVAVVVDENIATFDLKTGQAVFEQRELPKRIRAVPLFVDGKDPSVLLVEENSYVFRSLRTGKEMWRRPLLGWEQSGPRSPVVADLHGDGKLQVILPFYESKGYGPEGNWDCIGTEVIDVATGQTRWRHRSGSPSQHGHSQQIRFLIGQDIDRDGQRKIFTASFVRSFLRGSSDFLQVEALAGQDGHALWTYQRPDHPYGQAFDKYAIAALHWWQQDEDGQPQLLVCQGHVDPAMPNADADVYVLSASTGHLRHVVPEFGSPGVADLNGDGIPDLYALLGGKFHSLAGQPGEAWRWMQADWKPLRVRDGISTELVALRNRWLFFISADNGRLLRRSELSEFYTLPSEVGDVDVDLDGDGVSDLLTLGMERPGGKAWPDLFLQANLGRTGENLWRSNLRISQQEFPEFRYLVCPDLHGTGRPEVLCIYQTQKHDSNAMRKSCTLAVLSGRDGRVRWQQPLIDKADWTKFPPSIHFVPGIGDLDGDGVKDVVIWAFTPDLKYEIRAFSGVDGHLLWSHPLDRAQEEGLRRWNGSGWAGEMVVSVGDLDGDGKPEVIVQRPDKDQLNRDSCEILVLEGRDGKTRWSSRVPASPLTAISARSGNNVTRTNLSGNPTPLLLSGAGGSRVAVLTVDPASEDQAHLVLLDRTGKECGRAPVAIPGPLGNFKWNASVRPLPRDRLLLIGSGTLRLVQDGVEKTCWTWPIPGGSGVMADVLPASKGKAETIVVQAKAHVYGVDAGTGKTIWTCMGPGRCTHVLPIAGGLPSVLFEVNGNTVCRRAFAK